MKWHSARSAVHVERKMRDSMVAQAIKEGDHEPRILSTGDTLILWWPWPEDDREVVVYDLKIRRETRLPKKRKESPR